MIGLPTVMHMKSNKSNDLPRTTWFVLFINGVTAASQAVA